MTLTMGNLRSAVITTGLLLLVAAAVGSFIGFNGMDHLNLPVKAGIAVIAMTALATIVCYRPVTFPLGAYIFMVPFDNLLQTGAGTITKYLGLLSAFVVLVLLINRRRRVTPPAVVAVWALFLIYNVASFMWSEDPWFRTDLLVQTVQLFVLYAIVSALRIKSSEVKVLLLAVVAGAVACAGYGIWLFTHGTNVSVDSAMSQRLAITLGSNSYINADHFGAALVFPISVAMVAAIHFRGWRKLGAACALIVLLAGIYVSATRGSIVAVGAVWLYLMFRYRHRMQLGLLGVAGLAASIPFPNMWSRFFDPTQGNAGGRYGIWGIAWDAFRQRWLGGIGTGQFRLAYSDSYLRASGSTLVHPWQEDAHNIIVSTSVELGIVGLFLILFAWTCQVLVAKNVSPTSPLFDWRMAVEAGVVGLFVDALSVDLTFYKYLWIAFMLGVLIRNAGVGEEKAALAAPVRRMPAVEPYPIAREVARA